MMTTSIGVAPLFHSPIPPEKRLGPDTQLRVKTEGVQWTDSVCLFRIPEHLRRRWWNLAAKELLEQAGSQTGFMKFAESFRHFANFKGIPMRSDDSLEVIARAPGSDRDFDSSSLALINLGDEATSVRVNGEPVLLEPGDGCWVPPSLSLGPGDTASKADIDVLLKVTRRG